MNYNFRNKIRYGCNIVKLYGCLKNLHSSTNAHSASSLIPD